MGVALASPAGAANGCYYNGDGKQICDIEIHDPGEQGGGNEEPIGNGPGGFTPGPSECTYTEGEEDSETIECSRDGGYWSNDLQCYWGLVDPQSPPPAGKDATQGAWYECRPYEACTGVTPEGLPTNCYSPAQWLDTPPPGIVQYTPEQAAGMLVKEFVLEPVTIGLAPAEKVHDDDPPGTAPYRRTWVGIPVWAWVEDTSASKWGPVSESGTFGGVTVSATATVQSLTWDPGDGQSAIGCGEGTRFDINYWANKAAEDSPTCGWRYQQTSGDGTFTVSATTNWIVEWEGGGASGQIAMPALTTQTQVRVGELQSVNVSPSGQ